MVGDAPPAVALSFANNFWGKEDAGVEPLLQRMHNAKQTCDELKSFYTARAALEDEYARKLMSLSRKPLGSQESGTLRSALDVLRGEVEQMGKSHQNNAAQMKTELEEPLAAFSGAMKERRKIVQGGIEKLLKIKTQQTQHVNKTRDKYEQECLKIKGYLAQGHMVMGQEERKNKAKLEKTQINLATSNTEYENAVKALEETTGRWNRDWKAAADKFQDLEEERLDFMKASLWSFANIASTVCVSDDASCEKVRLSLENCEVEKDIIAFIKDSGTGQEIPDPPKYINFCRGDVDSQSEASEDDNYSVAQFQRTINPAYRSSSPQPSTYESHHEPRSSLGLEPVLPQSRETSLTPQKPQSIKSKQAQVEDYEPSRQPRVEDYEPPTPVQARNGDYSPSQQRQPDYNASPSRKQLDYQQPPASRRPSQPPAQAVPQTQPLRKQLDYQSPQSRQPQIDYRSQPSKQQPDYQALSLKQPQAGRQPEPTKRYEQPQQAPLSAVPHDPHPLEGMTMFCRTGPPSERSSANSPIRPSSRDSQSEYSNPTSFSSQEPPSPTKQVGPPVEKQVMKKKSGFFNSPFRRKSNKEKDHPAAITPSSRNTWSARSTTNGQNSPTKRPMYGQPSQSMISDRPSGSPEPIDPRASFQLNVGNNVFDVAAPEPKKKLGQKEVAKQEENLDPIAQALAELKDATKVSATRVQADKYHGVPSPAPGSTPSSRPIGSQMVNVSQIAGMRGTPPPSYDQPISRLGLPQPAFTSKAMQQTRQKYVDQTQNMFSPPAPRPDSSGYVSSGSRPGTRGSDMPRATSPAPPRAVSPRPNMHPDPRQSYRAPSPNPNNQYSNSNNQRTRAPSASPQKRTSANQNGSYSHHNSPGGGGFNRAVSPAPFRGDQERPNSSHVDSDMGMQMQLAPGPGPDEWNNSQNGQGSSRAGSRAGSRARSRAGGSPRSGPVGYYGGQQEQQLTPRSRSKSLADVRQYNREGRPILHFARALYVYQAAIPEELSFAKGDVLAVLRLQDDGWWEAEVAGKNGRPGLVPSNYLQNC